jgi:hypothetical protein
MAHDVFISHSIKDRPTADAVCAVLEAKGIRCWIAPRDVIPSMEWGECIIEAIEESRIMVLVFTTHANASPQIRREVERAVNRGVSLLPLRVDDVTPGKALEYFIGNVHWLDAITPPFEAHLRVLADTVAMLLARMPTHDTRPETVGNLSDEDKETKPRPKVRDRQERRLDAGMPRRIPLGQATQVVAMVRQVDSKGLKGVLQIEEDYSVLPEEVRTQGFEIEFPLDVNGNPRAAEFALRLDAPDFEPRLQTKNLFVPVVGDSEVCSFLVTAQRPGELLLGLEVLKGESCLMRRAFKTTAQPKTAEGPWAGTVLVSVPLYTSVFRTDTAMTFPLIVQKSGPAESAQVPSSNLRELEMPPKPGTLRAANETAAIQVPTAVESVPNLASRCAARPRWLRFVLAGAPLLVLLALVWVHMSTRLEHGPPAPSAVTSPEVGSSTSQASTIPDSLRLTLPVGSPGNVMDTTEIARSSTQSLSGVVENDLGERVPGVVISVTDAQSGRPLARGVTDDGGRFAFPHVPGGTYFLRLDHKGFKELRLEVEVVKNN